MALHLCPISRDDANAFVRLHHRHHGPVVGWKFGTSVVEGERVVGVVIVGRPVSRTLDDGLTLEVTRCCTDGTRNAASLLYGAASRAAFALGYRRVVTYTLTSEPGTSLRAAGWKVIAEVRGKTWFTPSRPREDKTPIQAKLRWEVER